MKFTKRVSGITAQCNTVTLNRLYKSRTHCYFVSEMGGMSVYLTGFVIGAGLLSEVVLKCMLNSS